MRRKTKYVKSNEVFGECRFPEAPGDKERWTEFNRLCNRRRRKRYD